MEIGFEEKFNWFTIYSIITTFSLNYSGIACLQNRFGWNLYQMQNRLIIKIVKSTPTTMLGMSCIHVKLNLWTCLNKETKLLIRKKAEIISNTTVSGVYIIVICYWFAAWTRRNYKLYRNKHHIMFDEFKSYLSNV